MATSLESVQVSTMQNRCLLEHEWLGIKTKSLELLSDFQGDSHAENSRSGLPDSGLGTNTFFFICGRA